MSKRRHSVFKEVATDLANRLFAERFYFRRYRLLNPSKRYFAYFEKSYGDVEKFLSENYAGLVELNNESVRRFNHFLLSVSVLFLVVFDAIGEVEFSGIKIGHKVLLSLAFPFSAYLYMNWRIISAQVYFSSAVYSAYFYKSRIEKRVELAARFPATLLPESAYLLDDDIESPVVSAQIYRDIALIRLRSLSVVVLIVEFAIFSVFCIAAYRLANLNVLNLLALAIGTIAGFVGLTTPSVLASSRIYSDHRLGQTFSKRLARDPEAAARKAVMIATKFGRVDWLKKPVSTKEASGHDSPAKDLP